LLLFYSLHLILYQGHLIKVKIHGQEQRDSYIFSILLLQGLYGGSLTAEVLWKLAHDRKTFFPETPDIGPRQLYWLSENSWQMLDW